MISECGHEQTLAFQISAEMIDAPVDIGEIDVGLQRQRSWILLLHHAYQEKHRQGGLLHNPKVQVFSEDSLSEPL